MNVLHLREHGRIVIGSSFDPAIPAVTLAQARALVRAAAPSGALRFHSDRQLRAREIVGVVVAGDVQVEVLPKIDGLDDGSTRLNLVRMLTDAGFLPFETIDTQSIEWKRADLLDAIIRTFLHRLENEARRGLSRHYLNCADDLPKLRGRLDVMRQYARNTATPQLLSCRFDEFSVDTPLNRAFKCALHLIAPLARFAETRRRAALCLTLFDEVVKVTAAQIDWSQIHIDRTNSGFRTLLSITRLLLSGLRQTTRIGASEGYALLFDMNLLFEQYVGRHIARAFPGRVRLQGPRAFAAREYPSMVPAFQTVPDIAVLAGNDRTIIDTKWKRLDPSERLLGVNQADVYQMMAYAQVYNAERLILLYPDYESLRDTALPRQFAVSGSSARLEIATLRLDLPSRVPESLRHLVAHSWTDQKA